MGMYFDNRYSRRGYWNMDDDYYAQSESWGIPSAYYLGNTPLNESLVYINTLLPMFKKKYDIERMTFITLTDGVVIMLILILSMVRKKIGIKLLSLY